ncbi:MAG: glutamine amidotransferase-related protein [Caulobacteraceae bacterium]
MKVGILEAGAPPAALAGQFDGYADMVLSLLGPDFAGQAYDVRAGELPQSATACEAWVITGSSAGVYDPDPWIAPLMAFVQQASGQAPMIGVCFGHQLMAQAFGGQVIKSPKGWGVGLHSYDVDRPAAWMDAAGPVRLAVSHQDQVVAIGPNGERIGGSAFTPFGMVAYPERRAFSIQAHPEFAPDYAAALVDSRRGRPFDAPTADAAVQSLAGPNDRDRVAVWLRRFLATA